MTAKMSKMSQSGSRKASQAYAEYSSRTAKEDRNLFLPFFVYGTLRKGFSSHRILGDCEYVGTGTVAGFYLAVPHTIPFALPAPTDETLLVGEVYAASSEEYTEMRKRLDRLESEGSWYLRLQVPVCLSESGVVVQCWMYALAKEEWSSVGTTEFSLDYAETMRQRTQQWQKTVVAADAELENDEEGDEEEYR